MRTLLRFASFASLFVLLMPTNAKGIVILFAVFVALAILFWKGKMFSEKIIHREYLVFDIALAIYLSVFLYPKWICSSKLALIANFVGLSSSAVLIVLTIFAGVFSIIAIDELVEIIKQVDSEKITKKSIVILCVITVEYCQMLYSTLNSMNTLTNSGGYC